MLCKHLIPHGCFLACIDWEQISELGYRLLGVGGGKHYILALVTDYDFASPGVTSSTVFTASVEAMYLICCNFYM